MNRILRACLVVPTMMVCATAMGSVGEESGEYARELVELDRYVDVEKRAGQDPKLTLVVAISGGGYRAANFALGALLAMEQIRYVEPPASLDAFWQEKRPQDSNLLNEVDYFSTVSGGGLAAAITVMSRLRASRIAAPEGGEPTCSGQGRRLLTEWMSRPGVLESLRENHTIRLVTSKFTPSVMFTSKTSGDALQMRLDDSILRRKEPGGECRPKEAGAPYVLGDVLPRKGGKVTVPIAPYLFMNSTNIATGQIIPLTPGWVDRKKVKEYWHGGGQEVFAGDNSCGPFCVPLALALRSSMNFPAGIPPTQLHLRDEKFVYLTDGGESDNLGSVTAVEILNQEGKGPANRRMLIVIDAFRGLGRKDYDTEEIPGLVNSVLRATSLPLEAHRFRVKRDFYSATAGQPSVLDAISDAGDVSVAYVDMEREPKALDIGTTLRLSPEQQQHLICAGKRQALVALGRIDSWDQVKRTNFGPGGANFECVWDADAGACPDGGGGEGEVCQGIVAFNQQSKTSLIGALKEGFKRTMRRVRNPVRQLTPRLENAVAKEFRNQRRELILEEAARARKKLAAPTVNLTEGDLRAFHGALDRYASGVMNLRTQLGRHSSADDAKPNDAADGASVDKDEVSFLERIGNWFIDFLRSDEEEAGEGGPPPGEKTGGTGAPGPEGAVGEANLQEMSEALRKMSSGVEDIKRKLGTRAVNSRELGELAEEVFDLNRLHERVVTLVVELETGDSGNLSELFRDLSDLIGAPQRELIALQKLLNTRFEAALTRHAAASGAIVADVEEKLQELESEVDKDVMEFKKRDVWQGALAVVKKVDDVDDIEKAIRNGRVCLSLKETKRRLETARRRLNGLADGAAGEQAAWGFDPKIEIRALRDWLGEQRKVIDAEIHRGILEAERLLYFWPDLERRDRFTYEQFLSFRSLGDFAAKKSEPPVEPPYERACGGEQGT